MEKISMKNDGKNSRMLISIGLMLGENRDSIFGE